ncbi:MAG: hypothetical protein U1F13_05875 [Acinetobacter parvus]
MSRDSNVRIGQKLKLTGGYQKTESAKADNSKNSANTKAVSKKQDTQALYSESR